MYTNSVATRCCPVGDQEPAIPTAHRVQEEDVRAHNKKIYSWNLETAIKILSLTKSYKVLSLAFAAMRWRIDGSESDSDSSSDSSFYMEQLSPSQHEYTEIGKTFLKLGKLKKWFDNWDGDFTYASDCSFFALTDSGNFVV